MSRSPSLRLYEQGGFSLTNIRFLPYFGDVPSKVPRSCRYLTDVLSYSIACPNRKDCYDCRKVLSMSVSLRTMNAD